MSSYPIDGSNWSTGLTMQDFIDGMGQHKEAMSRRYAKICLSQDECQDFAGFDRQIFVAVMTEEWCTDCLMNLPILARIAEAAPRMELRIFIRNEWPELRAYYTDQDIHSIPVASLMDENFAILSHWVERPQAAHERLNAWKAAHPEVEEVRRRFDLTSDEKRAMLKEINEQLLTEMEGWYDNGLQSETVCEVADLLGVKVSC